MYRLISKFRATISYVLLLALSWAPCAFGFSASLKPGELTAGFQSAVSPQPGTPAPDIPTNADLRIVVLAGDKAANIIDTKGVGPVVEILDKNNVPVAGAMVTFAVPPDGPGVIFASGLREATVMTDDTGRAIAPPVTALNPGSFQYRISATFREQKATASISQTNFLTAADAANAGAAQGAQTAGNTAKKHSNRMIWFIVGGVAVAVGVAAGFHGGSSSSPGTTPTAVIGAGSGPTVGAPH